MLKIPVLNFNPPRPISRVNWENIVSLNNEENSCSDDTNDMWLAKLSDTDDPFTLGNCLKLLKGNEWQRYFRLSVHGKAFAWTFDGVNRLSNNPYFELLFRTLRRACVGLNKGQITDAELQQLVTCVKDSIIRLDESETNDAYEIQFQKFGHETPRFHNHGIKSNQSWIDPNLYVALFSLFNLKQTLRIVTQNFQDFIESVKNDGDVESDKLFLTIRGDYKNLKRTLTREKRNSMNPLSCKAPFLTFASKAEEYLEAIFTAANALITDDCSSYESAVSFYAQHYQPSFLKLLKDKGFSLLTTSSPCQIHETDRNVQQVFFTVFKDDNKKTKDIDDHWKAELKHVIASYNRLNVGATDAPSLVLQETQDTIEYDNEQQGLRDMFWGCLKAFF